LLEKMRDEKSTPENSRASQGDIENESVEPLLQGNHDRKMFSEGLSLKAKRNDSAMSVASELCVIVLIFLISNGFTSTMVLKKREIPQVSYTGNMFVNSSDLSFPVYLKGATCTAEVLLECVPDSTEKCCEALFDANHAGPEESFSIYEALAVTFGLPLVYFGTRSFAVGLSQTILDVSGLGLAYTVSLFFTGVAKRLVGRPRPNFYALVAYASNSKANHSHLATVAYESFPSGHAASTSTLSFFLTFCLWRDIRRFNAAKPFSLLLWIASLCPVLIAFWIGLTRIHDYWHFFDDVAVGWMIGAFAAGMSYMYENCPEDKPNRVHPFASRYDDGL